MRLYSALTNSLPLNILLSSAYLPPIHYFARLYAAQTVYLEGFDHYVKQTYRNRCIIAGPDGPLALTLPIVHDKRAGHTATRDIGLSNHGDWRHQHTIALTSAYEGSPFFEYYAPEILPLYEQPWERLMDFNTALLRTLLDLLDLHPDIRLTTSYADTTTLGAEDLRELIRPKLSPTLDVRYRQREYYQVFRHRTGFQPNLSIVDLLFNMGPEARLVLRDSMAAPH